MVDLEPQTLQSLGNNLLSSWLDFFAMHLLRDNEAVMWNISWTQMLRQLFVTREKFKGFQYCWNTTLNFLNGKLKEQILKAAIPSATLNITLVLQKYSTACRRGVSVRSNSNFVSIQLYILINITQILQKLQIGSLYQCVQVDSACR